MARIILATFGSFGDLHPYMAIALELQSRGHQPVIATSKFYRKKIQDEGIEFFPVRPDMRPTEEGGDFARRVMDARTGSEEVMRLMMDPIRETYEDTLRAVEGADLLVSHQITFAAPLVAEKTGMPWVSTVLSPISLWTNYEPTVLPPVPWMAGLQPHFPGFSGWLLRIAKNVSRKWVLPVDRLRQELGLPPGGHPILEGQHSPQRVLALFSRVLGEPQPDWPRQVQITGFAFFDRKDRSGLDPELRAFLDAGPAPIVFTLGSSAVWDAGSFFRESAQAAKRLGRRAVLLVGGDPRNVAEGKMPEGIMAFPYAPYSEIFPCAAAIVHQGGVGTTAQALRAGRPMLIMPYSHDQPDNAARITRRGVGLTISRSRYTAPRAAALLRRLLEDPSFAENAAAVGRQVQAENGAAVAAQAMVEAAGGWVKGDKVTR